MRDKAYEVKTPEFMYDDGSSMQHLGKAVQWNTYIQYMTSTPISGNGFTLIMTTVTNGNSEIRQGVVQGNTKIQGLNSETSKHWGSVDIYDWSPIFAAQRKTAFGSENVDNTKSIKYGHWNSPGSDLILSRLHLLKLWKGKDIFTWSHRAILWRKV